MCLFLCSDACFLTADPNSANTGLSLSEENREVTHVKKKRSYPDHPDRFVAWPQVLCRESVCGRCYWEIDWSGADRVEIAVSYTSIKRKGGGIECVFGCNDHSWSLLCSSSNFSFRYNSKLTSLSVELISRRIGVFVDHSAGSLIFYSIFIDSMILIHSVCTTFTEPLYPGCVVYGGSVKLC